MIKSQLFPSYACAISDGAVVVVTGGFASRRGVSVYSMSGFEGNLPDLHEGRQYHTCARYQDEYDQNVGRLKCVPVLIFYLSDIFSDGRLHRTREHKIHGDLHSWFDILDNGGGSAKFWL